VDSLSNTVFRDGESNVGALVTDNIGVASVNLMWYNAMMGLEGFTALERVFDRPDYWVGKLRWTMHNDETIYYLIQAIDEAEAHNVSLSSVRSFALQREVQLDDFERESPRWVLNGWLRSEGTGRDRGWSLADRESNKIAIPREATAILDEIWDLSTFGRFRLFFWERRRFDSQGLEAGLFEVSLDEGESWETLLRLTGVQDWWVRHQINLDPFTGGRVPEIQIRFRTTTSPNAEPGQGWFIDNISLSTDVIVTENRPPVSTPASRLLTVPWPNPANSSISIKYRIPAFGQLKLLDITGRTAVSLPLYSATGNLTLDMSEYGNGIYFVVLECEKKVLKQQFILLK